MSKPFAFGVAIIGTGWGLTTHLPAIVSAPNKSLSVNAIWLRSPEKVETVRKSAPSALLSSNFSDLLKQNNVQIVDITTPPNTHKEFAIEALKAGKHVLCEKPFAMNLQEAKEMLDEAQKRPGQLSIVDHELRLLPAVQKMKNLVTKEKWCGQKIYHIEMKIHRGRQTPNMAWNWWNDKTQGGGMLGAVGSHLIDLLHFVTEKKVVRVNATVRTFLKERVGGEATSDDYAVMNLELEDGSFAVLSTSAVKYSADKKFSGTGGLIMEVSGNEGGLVFESHKLYGKRLSDDKATVFFAEEMDSPNIWVSGTQELFKQMEEKLNGTNPDALKNMATFEDGYYVQKVLDAVHESSRTGKWIDIEH
jgi:predicted dehydrogenase